MEILVENCLELGLLEGGQDLGGVEAGEGGDVALLFLTHKSTGPNKNFYHQNLGSRLGNFYKAPELDMKYPHLSSGEGKKH